MLYISNLFKLEGFFKSNLDIGELDNKRFDILYGVDKTPSGIIVFSILRYEIEFGNLDVLYSSQL